MKTETTEPTTVQVDEIEGELIEQGYHVEPDRIVVQGYRPDKGIPMVSTKDEFGNAGFDLTASEDVTLQAGQILRVKVNAHFAIPEGYFGYVTPRSGLASEGLNVIQGVIDSNYRGQLQAIVKNETDQPHAIVRGLRLAQILFLKHETPIFIEMDAIEDLGKTVRGDSSFGESGKF